MKCKRCGNTVLPNQVFCNKCGAPIEEEDKKKFSLFNDDYKEGKQKNPRFIIIISVIVALIIILLVVLLILNKKDQNNTTNTTEQASTFTVVYENYNFTIPGDYSQGNNDNRLNIYNENDEFIGAFDVSNTSFSKAVSNRVQLIESKIVNTTNYKYSVLSQEQKSINGLNCYIYKVKVTGTENGQTITGYFYIALAEIDDNNIAYVSSYITEDENTTYSYLEKIISIVKTAEQRAVNTNTSTTNTTTNTVTNNAIQSTTKTVNTTNSVVSNTR